MLDLILPASIVRVEKSFILDDDRDDFENDSTLGHYLKDDQQKIKSKYHLVLFFFILFDIEANSEFPNLRHMIFTIILIIEKLDKVQLIDPIYLERFRMIYEVWIVIDNDINSRDKTFIKDGFKKTNENRTKKLSWNFINECQNYEKIFGKFTTNTK